MNTNEIHNLYTNNVALIWWHLLLNKEKCQKVIMQENSISALMSTLRSANSWLHSAKITPSMQDRNNKSLELIKWHLNLKQIQLTSRRDKTCLCCWWQAVRAVSRHASRVIRYQQEIETQFANRYDILHILCRCRVDCDIVWSQFTKSNSGLLSLRVQPFFFSFWVSAASSPPTCLHYCHHCQDCHEK